METKPQKRRSESIFACCFEGCSATFVKNSRLESHMRLHTGERPFVCAVEGCKLSYTRNFHLTRHIKACHAVENVADPPASTKFKCTVNGCSKEFSSNHTLYKHLKYSHEKRKFQCDRCSKAFTKHQQLKIHSHEHTGVLPFKCAEPGCEKAFLLPSRLKRHQRTHAGYPCGVEGCSRTFAKWSVLRKHHKVDHQKSHPCERCGRAFFSKGNLRCHLATHESKRECFACPVEGCGRFYLNPSGLREHVRTAHENKRFSCDVPGCDRKFFAKQSLLRHEKLHDPNRPLPQKRRQSTKGRRKGFPVKSAAATVSGYRGAPEEDRLLLSDGGVRPDDATAEEPPVPDEALPDENVSSSVPRETERQRTPCRSSAIREGTLEPAAHTVAVA